MSRRIAAVAGACLAATIGLSVAPAAAQTLYLGAEGGWSVLPNQSDHASGLPTAHVSYNSGFAAGARIGYEWGPWRFEEEYIYHGNDLARFHIGGTDIGGASGSRDSHAAMTNLLYDLNFGWPVTPHIGAGIGAVDVIDHANLPGLGVTLNDDNWQFGYQAIAGVRYNMTPNIALDLDYRYLATLDTTFHVPGTGISYRSGYNTHTVMASLVYRFGPPPAPPPVVAPPAPPAPPPVAQRRVFLVFFDWDSDRITEAGMQVVEQAAAAYKSGAPVQLQVTGYTDRSGSAGYNQRLSERRANAVAETLVRLGVPRDEMAVSGRGENDNRVPTANGVREPQNRRVEIVLA
ncbi:MAG TPA: OmpA family protein [Stellaceae bacterium]|nr:OmpA family protein [Stellaceae bacterium]